jgi:flavin reductase (DIM6/NTAB) family NADH-FMN oxidoreductase RutF
VVTADSVAGVAAPTDPSTQWAEAITADADYPLYVVTATDGTEMSGCLAGFVTQSSIEPVRFIICISEVNHTFAVARRSRGLALHLLGSDQKPLASLFGQTSGDMVDKFATLAWSTAVTGAPVLTDCAAWIDGSVLEHRTAGDHEAFLVAVVAGGSGPHEGRLMLSDVPDFEAGHGAGSEPD